MKLTIERKNNGAVLKTNDRGIESIDEVYKFEDTQLADLMIMLYTIAEWVYKPVSGYDKFTIQIQVVHGRKYACLDKKCSICNK